MPRVPRMIAKDLIQYAKSLNVTGNFFDPKAKSAFEFARQMSSPKLKKINPQFECKLEVTENDETPKLTAEFIDGAKWSVDTTAFTAERLRFEFFNRAGDAEDNLDVSPADAAAAKGKGADKGGKKK